MPRRGLTTALEPTSTISTPVEHTAARNRPSLPTGDKKNTRQARGGAAGLRKRLLSTGGSSARTTVHLELVSRPLSVGLSSAAATGASGLTDTHVSDTWKCGSVSFIAAQRPENKTKRKTKKQTVKGLHFSAKTNYQVQGIVSIYRRR